MIPQILRYYTWTYSTGLSSPVSRLATYRVAGNAFGARWRRTRFREFVTVMLEIATEPDATGSACCLCQVHKNIICPRLTSVLVLEKKRSRIIDPAAYVSHFLPLLFLFFLYSFFVCLFLLPVVFPTEAQYYFQAAARRSKNLDE